MAVPVINVWFIAFIYGIIFAFATFVHISLTATCFRKLQTVTTFLESVDQEGTEEKELAWKTCWKEMIPLLWFHRCVGFCGWLVFLFLMNYGFVYKLFLNGQDDVVGAQILFFCFFLTLGVTYVLCNNVTFIKVFENTIGYGIVTAIYGLRGSFMKSYIQKPEDNVHYDFLFSVFRLDNFGDVLMDVKQSDKYDFEIKQDQEVTYLHLLEKVHMKHIIGHTCWIYFATLVSTLIASKYMAKHL